MKAAYEQIQDLVIITQHQNQQYNNQLSASAIAKLNLLLKSISNLVRVNYDVDKTGKRAEASLKKKINKELTTGLSEIDKFIQNEIDGFMGDNSALYKDQVEAVFEPVKKYVKVESVDTSEIIDGYNSDFMTFDKSGTHTVASIWLIFVSRLTAIVEQVTTQACLLEKTEEDFANSIYGDSADTNVSKGNLSSVVGALLIHAASSVMKYTNEANTNIFNGYVYQAVMDSATTEICASLNGKYWIYGNADASTLPYEVYPGLHYNCRSSISPITKSYIELGINPEDLTEAQKQLLATPSIEAFSYNDFIKSQPVSVQKEILGSVRYNMMKINNLTPKQFYSSDGTKLSLSALSKKGYKVSKQYLQYIRK